VLLLGLLLGLLLLPAAGLSPRVCLVSAQVPAPQLLPPLLVLLLPALAQPLLLLPALAEPLVLLLGLLVLPQRGAVVGVSLQQLVLAQQGPPQTSKAGRQPLLLLQHLLLLLPVLANSPLLQLVWPQVSPLLLLLWFQQSSRATAGHLEAT
jgi:hypothetical protein